MVTVFTVNVKVTWGAFKGAPLPYKLEQEMSGTLQLATEVHCIEQYCAKYTCQNVLRHC